MRKYSAYKDSGIEWIGEIPEHWQLKRLKYIVDVNNQALPETTPDDFEIEYIDIGSVSSYGKITNTQKLTFKEAPSRARRIVNKGDTIVSTVRTYLKAIAQIKSAKKNLIASTGFAVLSVRDSLNDDYLYYVALSEKFVDTICANSYGVSYPAISSSDLMSIPIWIPPLSEQTQIASYLDRKTAQIDELVSKKEKLITLLQEERTALINQAVTQGLDHTLPMKGSGIEWLGEIPAHWEVKKLKYLCKIRYGLGQPPRQKEDGLPIIRATNITRGKILKEDMIYVDPDDLPLDRQPFLSENDVLVVRSGAYTADSAIVTKEYDGAVVGYDMVMTPISVNPKLLSFSLLSTYMLENQLFLLRLRAAQPHLNAEELGNTLMVVPPEGEQKKIVKHIEREHHRVDEILSKTEKEIKLLREYKTALISEVVTGKVDVREEVLA